MKNKMVFVYVGLAVLLAITGFVVWKTVSPAPEPAPVEEEESAEIPAVDSSVTVTLTGASKPNAVVLNVTGLSGKYATVGYEFSYESKGLIKGVNSGSKPIDVAGKNDFEREVYLGTCSRNVCTPDTGVTKISVILEFTDTSGRKSQFSKDFDI